MGSPLRPGDSTSTAPRDCLLHFDRQPKFAGDPTTSIPERLRPGGNTIPLLDDFRVSNCLIRLTWCSGFFDLPSRLTFSNAGVPHPTNVVAVECSAFLPFQAAATINTLPRSAPLRGFVGVLEKRKIAAAGRAVSFRLSCNRVAKGLV